MPHSLRIPLERALQDEAEALRDVSRLIATRATREAIAEAILRADALRSRRAAVQRLIQEKRAEAGRLAAEPALEPLSPVPLPTAQAAEWVARPPDTSEAIPGVLVAPDELGSIEQQMARFEAAVDMFRQRLAQPSLPGSFRASMEDAIRMLERLLAILGVRRQGLIRRRFGRTARESA